MHKDAAHAGQAIYTPLTLALYDQAVLGVSCRGQALPFSRVVGQLSASYSS